MGALNSVVVLEEGEIMVTVASLIPLPAKGWDKVKLILYSIFKINNSVLAHCKFPFREGHAVQAGCMEVAGTESIMANGLTYDGKQALFMVDTFANELVEWKLDLAGERMLSEVNRMRLEGGGDNVVWDDGRLYLASIPSFLEIQPVRIPSFIQVDPQRLPQRRTVGQQELDQRLRV